MFSSFSSTSNGCDSCATLDDAFGSQVQNVNPTANTYAQNNVVQQQAYNVCPGSVGGPSVVSNARPAVVNVATVAQPVQQVNNNNAQVAMNNMVQKAVTPTTKVVSVVNSTPVVAVKKNKEGFVAAQNNQVQVNIPGRLVLLNIGIVVLASLACNECFKYYINRAIQNAEGQPHYYLAYAVAIVLMVMGVHMFSKRNL